MGKIRKFVSSKPHCDLTKSNTCFWAMQIADRVNPSTWDDACVATAQRWYFLSVNIVVPSYDKKMILLSNHLNMFMFFWRLSNSESRCWRRNLSSCGSYVVGRRAHGWIRQQCRINLLFLIIIVVIVFFKCIEKGNEIPVWEEAWGVLQASDRVGHFSGVWRWIQSWSTGST